jgi:hypothetical protein
LAAKTSAAGARGSQILGGAPQETNVIARESSGCPLVAGWSISEKVHRDIYEWDDLFWTNMSNIDHNDDDPDWEETQNPWPYDEKEVGSTRPETFATGVSFWIQTVACPLSFNGNGYIYTWLPFCARDVVVTFRGTALPSPAT